MVWIGLQLMRINLDGWKCLLMNLKLESFFYYRRDKSLDLYGFSMVFFQYCWDVVKGDLMRVFMEFFENGVVNACTNESFICLNPKKEESVKIDDFKPISLVISLYKIWGKCY